METHMRISDTGFWESQSQLYHVRCEALSDWIINYLKEFKNKTTYDFGCGNGQYCSKLAAAGFSNLIGFEGKIPNFAEYNNIRQQDLSIPFTLSEKGNVIFLEVAEHIPAQFEDVMLTNITNACDDKLIMSWAVRGQPGWGHVNCINNDEAIAKVCAKGFSYLENDSMSARSVITDSDCPWFKNTTLIFQKI